MTATTDTLLDIYQRLLACYGPQHWWPAADAFEVIVGAILTQSAAWTNVEKAIANLKAAGTLNPQALLAIPTDKLSTLIHPCGYYNAKARKLKAFAERLHSCYGDDLRRLLDEDAASLRQWLLGVHGIGEETADSIILYAAKKPLFVVDGYTRRILRRLGLAPSANSYDAFQALFTDNLPRDEALYNEYHALLVRHGKEACRRTPRCPQCCLQQTCQQAGASD